MGWANMNLFDEKGYLTTGRRCLPLWRSSFTSPETETTHQLNLTGTVAENPDPEFTLVVSMHILKRDSLCLLFWDLWLLLIERID